MKKPSLVNVNPFVSLHLLIPLKSRVTSNGQPTSSTVRTPIRRSVHRISRRTLDRGMQKQKEDKKRGGRKTRKWDGAAGGEERRRYQEPVTRGRARRGAQEARCRGACTHGKCRPGGGGQRPPVIQPARRLGTTTGRSGGRRTLISRILLLQVLPTTQRERGAGTSWGPSLTKILRSTSLGWPDVQQSRPWRRRTQPRLPDRVLLFPSGPDSGCINAPGLLLFWEAEWQRRGY